MAATRDHVESVKMVVADERNLLEAVNAYLAAVPREYRPTTNDINAQHDPADDGRKDSEVTSSIPLQTGGSIP